jgi:hypothetical protein
VQTRGMALIACIRASDIRSVSHSATLSNTRDRLRYRYLRIAGNDVGTGSVARFLMLARIDAHRAKEEYPSHRLLVVVAARLEMDDGEATIFTELGAQVPQQPLRVGDIVFDRHLHSVINGFELGSLFCDDGPGRHHHAIRPAGYDYVADAVDPALMERWRADYRAMTSAQQMLAATIIWLYRGGRDNVWMRRVPMTWHAADAIFEMRQCDALADWGTLIALYPGW